MKKKRKKQGAARSEDLLKTSHALIKERTLGYKEATCRVCGASGQFMSYRIKEMMVPTRDEFEYFTCGNCRCLQIRDIPEDLGKYYQRDYYSYAEPELLRVPEGLTPKPDYILDVGCGAGHWLCAQPSQGYVNLFGCDPFIEKDLHYDNGVVIRKCTIHEMDGSFDYIQLRHSFEHMTDPHEVMQSIKRLLKPNGQCVIKIPVFPNIAFAIYGPFWYQADAPRHIILHSKESFVYLANLAGLDVVSVDYDSNTSQFIRSRLYQLDIPFHEQTSEITTAKFTKEEYDKMELMAKLANEEHTGDMASFVLRHMA